MVFEEYTKRVFEIIYSDYDGYTYDLDSLDKELAIPFANNVSIEFIANRLLKRHKYIMGLVDEMNQGNKESHAKLLELVNTHDVVDFNVNR